MRLPYTDTPVIVLRLDHYGALGIMRSLGRLGVEVYGVHKDRDAAALRSRYCAGGLVWDLDAAPAADSVRFLLEVGEKLGGRPLLLPSNDETALFVADNAAALRDGFSFQDNDAALVRALYSKKELYHLARRLGIPTAETVFPTCRADVEAFCQAARFPVMLKGSDGIALSRRAGKKMVIVRSAEELLARYDEMEDPARPDLMLQEYIPGGEDVQWMFNGYFDRRSRCLFGLTGRKLRLTPVYTGMTSLGVCQKNDAVARLTCDFMAAIGYRGILDIGYRFDARDGLYKVLDVNPRIGATFRLFVGDDGMDVVRAQYLDQTGQAVEPSGIVEGRRWFVEDLDAASSLRYYRDGVLSPGAYLRSFVGVEEAAWFARDDVKPFLVTCARAARAAVRQAARKVGIARQRPPRPGQREAHQEEVRRYFEASATRWKALYEAESLEPRIYQDRRSAALAWVDDIVLPAAARVLEVGCGAGHTAVDLARRGLRVHAVDVAEEMVRLTRRAAREAGIRHLTAEVADVHDLDLASGAYDLVLALGVLPWLESVERGLAELARVLRPGGYLIATADNRVALPRLIDPRATPLLSRPRRAVKRALEVAGAWREPPGFAVKKHDPEAVDRLVAAAGLTKVRSATVGFGPFSLFGRPVVPDGAGVRLHRGLQRLAEEGFPIVRNTGAHYLMLAVKPTRAA